MGLEEFRKRFPVFKAQGYAVMYYIFPYVRARAWSNSARTIPRPSPCRAGAGPTATASGANMGRRCRTGSGAAPRQPRARAPSADDLQLLFSPPGIGAHRAPRRDLAARPAHQLSAQPGPQQISSSACGPSAKAASSRSSRTIAISCAAYDRRTGFAAICRASAIRSRQDRNALLSYCWDGATLSIDPASTGGKEWEDFLRPTTISVASGAESRCSTRRRS